MDDQPPRRPTVHGAHLTLPDGRLIQLDTAEWSAWEAQALAFDVAHALGDFLVVREKRQRHGLYWVARRYDRGRRASVYLGAHVAAADVERAARELAAKIAAQAPAERKPPPARRVLSIPQLETLTQGSDPETMRSVLNDLLARERDPERRAALAALRSLVDALWGDAE